MPDELDQLKARISHRVFVDCEDYTLGKFLEDLTRVYVLGYDAGVEFGRFIVEQEARLADKTCA